MSYNRIKEYFKTNQETALEESSALYHKNVTRFQVNAQTLQKEIEDDNQTERDLYIQTHPQEAADEVTEKFEKILFIDIDRVRRDVALLISQEMEYLTQRNNSILKKNT